MMAYVTLSEFADLQDSNYIYKAGDAYPRDGYAPSAERIEELSTAKNRLHKPLIQAVPEPAPEPKPEPEPEMETEPEPEPVQEKKKRVKK